MSLITDDRYLLHKRLQDMSSRAAVAVNTLKAMHLVSYTTLYDFLHNPDLARPRTLQSVRLIIEFLDCACRARLLPVKRATLNERACTKEYYISELYEKWWDNGKKFQGFLGSTITEMPTESNAPIGVAVPRPEPPEPKDNKAVELTEIVGEEVDPEIAAMLRESQQLTGEE